MARGRKETPEETKRRCFILYDELQSYSGVGRQLDLAPNTVKSIILNANNIAKYGDLMQQIAKRKQENNDDLIERIKGIRYNEIVGDVLSLFTLKNMRTEMEVRGMRALIALQGNMLDKGMAYEKLVLDKRRIELAERTLELKEQELNARLDNPDAFSNIVIVNDLEELKHVNNNQIV